MTLICHACGHQHTMADWEYQSGNCHACGAPLSIPENDPEFADWHVGPKSKAAIELEQAHERETRNQPHPGPLSAMIPDGGYEAKWLDVTPDVSTEPHPESRPDVDADVTADVTHERKKPKGVVIPDAIQVDEETGKVTMSKRRRRK